MSTKDKQIILVVSENEDFSKSVAKAVKANKCKSILVNKLADAFHEVRTQDVHGVIIDTSVQFVPGNEVADALIGISPRLRAVALKARQVGRPPKNTPAGAFVLYADEDMNEMVRLATSSGRGRRPAFKLPPTELEGLLEKPLAVSRKTFLDAADVFYLKAATTVAAVKPRLVAAIAEDSLASAYRLLDEYEIPYGLAAGARPYRRKKAQKRRRRRRRRRS